MSGESDRICRSRRNDLPGPGAKGRTRTADRTIFSRELYQLSYLGMLQRGDAGGR